MSDIECLEAVVIGAGISGISAAYHIQKHTHITQYKLLERRDKLGGTWDLFNYPGIRSDSDMHTFGFSFKRWSDTALIAKKHSILSYLNRTAEEFGIDQRIDYGAHVTQADWCSTDKRWLLRCADGRQYRCQYLFMCSGYYSYDDAYTPLFEGVETFSGQVLHPQFWPDELDYTNKNVVVIGSGATAVTLVPAMAERAKHVTMVQRSPTYLSAQPSVNTVANTLSKWLGHWAARWWLILSNMLMFMFCRVFPNRAKRVMIKDIKALLGDTFDPKHFTPHYNPWDQRVCLCPDGDFFHAMREGHTSIETDTIKRFNPAGIELSSGKQLDADLVVTATGLNIQLFGGLKLTMDGKPVDTHQAYTFKGMMLSGVPNLFLAIGYTNASWTLKVDLTHRYASRIISHMHRHGHQRCAPQMLGPVDDAPLLNLNSGYIQRAQSDNLLPKQGSRKPWRLRQNYVLDTIDLKFAPVTVKELQYR